MKNHILLITVLLIISFTINSNAQDLESSKMDSLRFYKSQIDKYRFRDTNICEIYTQKIVSLADTQTDKKFLFHIYSTLGKVYRNNDLYDIAIKNLFKALEYDDEVDDPAQIVCVYDNLAIIYSFRGETNRMIEFINKSKAIKEEIGDLTGINYNNWIYPCKIETQEIIWRLSSFFMGF